MLPFSKNSADRIIALESAQHFKPFKDFISESHRILKKDGKWIIVDLGKPDNPITRFGVSFYLKMILPIVAYAAGGKLGLKFATLYGTYRVWPKNKKLESLLLEKFSKIEFDKDLMGGAIMIAAYK